MKSDIFDDNLAQINLKEKNIKYLFAIQMVLATFAPIIFIANVVGLDIAISFLTMGLSTLIFYYVSNKKVPVMLESSELYVLTIISIIHNEGLGALKTGLLSTAFVYFIMSFLINKINKKFLAKLFSPLVVSSLVMLTGIKTSFEVLEMLDFSNGVINIKSLILLVIVLFTFIFLSTKKTIIKYVSIFISILVGYVCAIILGMVNFEPLTNAKIVGFSEQALNCLSVKPVFSLNAIISMGFIAILSIVDHVVDIQTIGALTENDYAKNPGYKKTIFGEGIANFISAIFLSPPKNITDESISVLVLSKFYDPTLIKVSSIILIVLSFFGKLMGFLQTIPHEVIGGVAIILAGATICLGIEMFIKNKVSFTDERNIIILSVTFVLGIAIDHLNFFGISLSGISVAMITNVILNSLMSEK